MPKEGMTAPMTQDKLWCVSICMGRLEHVKMTAPGLISQSACKYIFVDWSCPQKSGDWVAKNHPQATVVRVPEKKLFSSGAAHNSGAKLVPSDAWICFIDCDVAAHPDFCRTALDKIRVLDRIAPDTYIQPSCASGLCGTNIVSQRNWSRVGGYDDVFDMWGHDDTAFYRLLEFSGVGKVSLSMGSMLTHFEHTNRMRSEFFRTSKLFEGAATNLRYCNLRDAQMRKLGRLLTSGERQTLYGTVARRTGGC